MFRLRRIIAITVVFLVLVPGMPGFAQQYVGNTSVVKLDSLTTKRDSLLKSSLQSVPVDPKYANTFETLSSLSDEQYDALVIPPLDALLASAEQCGRVKAAQGLVTNARLELNNVRRQWLKWLNIHANYSYGNSDMYAIQYLETTYPIWNYNNSQQRTSFWNVGATISIPLSDIFNYRTNIRKQKALVENFEGERQYALEDVKLQIIKLYVSAVQQLDMFKIYSENYAAAEAQYVISENDFLNGAINVHELFIMKNYQSGAKLDYEQCKAQLNEALLSLEVYSGLPIISEMKSAVLGQKEEQPEEDTEAVVAKGKKNKKSAGKVTDKAESKASNKAEKKTAGKAENRTTTKTTSKTTGR